MTHHRLIIAACTIIILGLLVAPSPAASAPQTHEITLNGQQFEFTPHRIQVHQGDKVVIHFTSSDVVHGFYLDDYGIEQRVDPGITTPIEFTASKAGKFRYRCSVSCGTMHPFMMGELVVGPNLPYWRALGVVFTALGGMLLMLAKRIPVIRRSNYESQAVA